MMNGKVILILVDGMRADSLHQCNNRFVKDFLQISKSSLNARAVMPTVTLPCHMSLFHSVSPQRHGILTNTYVPQVRPVKGLFERINESGKTSASFFNWEPLRDLSRPGHLSHSYYISMDYPDTDIILKDEAVGYIDKYSPDFVFLYLGETDGAGHKYGFQSAPYLDTVNKAWVCIEEVWRRFSEEYTVIVTSDHGGHDYTHGTDLDDDMVIPLVINSKAGIDMRDQVTIMDIAPTITSIMGIKADKDWEGNALI